MSTDFVETARPGEWVDTIGPLPDDHDLYPMRIPTDRYTSVEFQQREREAIWMRVWQIVGRVDELPKVGDWKVYRIFDQSFIIVRGKDERLRGFVNACRHRGNMLCQGTGNAKRGFLCQYHLWSYDLEGKNAGSPARAGERRHPRGQGRERAAAGVRRHLRRLHLLQSRSGRGAARGVSRAPRWPSCWRPTTSTSSPP